MLNKFKTKKVVESVTVGECFKAKREELGVTLQDLGLKLRIKPEYLESLENSDYDNLPAEVYVKGFVRSYADFVGFDAQKMVNMLKREMAVGDKMKKNIKKTEKKAKFDAGSPIITPKVVTLFFSAIILAVIGYYLWHQISSFNSKPYLLIKSPSENTIVEDSKVVIEGETEKEITVEINGVNVYVDTEGKFKETILLQPGVNQIMIQAKNRFNMATKEELSVVYQKKIEPVPLDYINGDGSL